MKKIICFFGALGSGKTTRARLLADFLQVPLYSEIADSPYLEGMFLERKNSLLNQLHFLYRDSSQILEVYKRSDSDYLIFDYYIGQVDAYSQYFLDSNEYSEFAHHYETIIKELPTPDIILYIRAKEDTVLYRIREREREYELIGKEFVHCMMKKLDDICERTRHRTSVITINANIDIIGSRENRLKCLGEMLKIID